MIHVLLLILKIIGIVLAVLLGTVLLLLCLVLFVPVRYKGSAVYRPQECDVRVKAGWLLSLCSVRAEYVDGGLAWRICVFGIPIRRSGRLGKKKPEEGKTEEENTGKKRKQGKKGKQKGKEKGKEKSAGKRGQQELPELSEKSGEEEARLSDGEPGQGTNGEPGQGTDGESGQSTDGQAEQGTDGKKGGKPVGKIAGFQAKLRGIREKIKDIRNKAGGVLQKAKKLAGQAGQVKDLLKEPGSRRALSLVLARVKLLTGHILPQKLKGYVVFGSGDPCSTGQILGAAAVFYARFGRVLDIRPDFEEKRLECDITFRGRMRAFTIIKHILVVIWNKDVKQVHKEFKEIKAAK